ncbi:hypothetical protein AAFO92_18475 [Roseovarius sp. CAU 1744]|uniref:hypothetical protein n=1 Tax=Roseovarius sp. CAU 1744 TaxID=3140368 RepID=UPI00325B5933
MLVLAHDLDPMVYNERSRAALICAAFESAIPSFFSLEHCLDAVERNEWSGLWW